MLIVDSNDKMHLDVNSLKSLLSTESYDLFLAILKENSIDEETFIKNDTACIVFVDSKYFFVSHVKEIAGLRLVMLTNSQMDFSNLSEKTWSHLEFVAKKFEADLIQIEVPFEKIRELNSYNKILLENYVFERFLDNTPTSVTLTVTPMDFSNTALVNKLAELEFLARLDFPHSTVRTKDSFKSISEEYAMMAGFPEFEGACIENDPNKGFMLWWSIKDKHEAFAVYAWVSEKYRGQSFGKNLVNAMINKLSGDGVKHCIYFVGAGNIPSIKNAMKGGFKIYSFVLNKHVGKAGRQS